MSTLHFMTRLINSFTGEETLEQLSERYKDKQCPTILAQAYVKSHKLIFATAGKFFGLSQQDIESYGLERLEFCLLTFNNKNKFSTYFTTVLYNKFREETQYLSTHKRKANLLSDSFDSLVETANFDIAYNPSNYSEAIDSMKSFGMKDRDIEVCILLAENYTKRDIAKKMGVSGTAIGNSQKRAQRILLDNGFIL